MSVYPDRALTMTKADRVRRQITRNLVGFTRQKLDRINRVFALLDDETDPKTREEICEALAEMIFPQGIARIAEVYHPNGVIS